MSDSARWAIEHGGGAERDPDGGSGLEELAEQLATARARVLKLERALVDVAATDDFYGEAGRRAKAERAIRGTV